MISLTWEVMLWMGLDADVAEILRRDSGNGF